jgi:hypothetical protein
VKRLGKTVRLFGEDATEVAKYYGMYLKHLGVLKSYEGSKYAI